MTWHTGKKVWTIDSDVYSIGPRVIDSSGQLYESTRNPATLHRIDAVTGRPHRTSPDSPAFDIGAAYLGSVVFRYFGQGAAVYDVAKGTIVRSGPAAVGTLVGQRAHLLYTASPAAMSA